jgi:hypothetical protein
MPPSPQQRLVRLRQRYRRLALRLAQLDFIAKGSVTQRHLPCGKPTCRCHADPPQLHGPYWQWSTAVAGKTVTRNLTEDQARLYLEWIGNRKHLEAILDKMHAIAAQAAELVLTEAQPPSHPRRASRQRPPQPAGFSGGSS